MKWAGKTETGKRPHNEDSYFVGTMDGRTVAAVSDGMGGHRAGEVASSLAIETLRTALGFAAGAIEGKTLSDALVEANRVVFEKASNNDAMYGMGATLVCAAVFPDRFLAANVGDSRMYLLHNDSIRQITHDHSYVAELVRRGVITHEEARTHPRRNLITRAIGAEPNVKVDLFADDWADGDTLLLCSDGLSGSLTDSEIAFILLAEPDPEKACDTLISRALQNGSTDNITVVLVKNAEDAQ